MGTTRTTTPLAGLYIHVPFCARVCPYCDFAVRTGGPKRRAGFVQHLIAEIESRKGWQQPIDTMHLGGGTPSCLTADQLDEVLGAARAHLPLRDDLEIGLEANPEDVTAESLAAWRDLGIERLSLGVQSFDDDELRFLGRLHDGACGRRSVRLALEAGFPVVSLDLIFGIGGQSAEQWGATVRDTLALEPHHISCYQLTFHERTPFWSRLQAGSIAEMPQSDQADRYVQATEILAAAGYAAYEVSNFARAAELESRHNTKYWRHAPYLGLGPSAHSFDGASRRWWNRRTLTEYEAAVAADQTPIASYEDLTPAALVLETVLFGMRTRRGLDCAAVAEDRDVDLWSPNAETFEQLQAQGLLQIEGRRVAPTTAGLAVADHLATRIAVPE